MAVVGPGDPQFNSNPHSREQVKWGLKFKWEF
jgi:hypothetical protein